MKSDSLPGLSASGVCSLTGVRPQTRETWVKRGLLRSAKQYGELDVIEQAVVKALLATLPKSHVDYVWHELRPCLRRLGHHETAWVWDPQARSASETTSAEQLRDAVLHGRPVYAIPVGLIAVEARAVYRAEIRAYERSMTARAQRPTGAQMRGTASS